MKLQITCDVDPELAQDNLAGVYKLHDSFDDLVVEAASLPALHEPHMHQGLCPPQPVTPGRGVGCPPCLHKQHACQPLQR